MDTKNQDKYRGMMLDGRYELVELIGSGGMAVVYKAMCHRLNRYVAVKIMRPELAKNEKFRRRFQTESQAIAKLSHPNIVGVYDVSRTDHVEYIVMELVDGITLKQYLQDHGPLDAVQAVDFSLQIARALAHAHGKGIVHRDIKPQNILVVNDGVIKVADFGIANLQSEVPDVENEAIGSVHYISPEQARGLPVDGRSDIYSLGIVMYEMLSGKLPFDGDDDRTVALKHLSAVPTPLREIAPSVPEALEKIVMKAMEASLDNRYQTADALAADLEALQKSLTGSLDRIEGNVAPLSTAGELGREDYVRRRRRAMDRAEREARLLIRRILRLCAGVRVIGHVDDTADNREGRHVNHQVDVLAGMLLRIGFVLLKVRDEAFFQRLRALVADCPRLSVAVGTYTAVVVLHRRVRDHNLRLVCHIVLCKHKILRSFAVSESETAIS